MNPGTLQFKTIAVALDLTGRPLRRCAMRKRWPACTTRHWYWCMSSIPSPTHFPMEHLLRSCECCGGRGTEEDRGRDKRPGDSGSLCH